MFNKMLSSKLFPAVFIVCAILISASIAVSVAVLKPVSKPILSGFSTGSINIEWYDGNTKLSECVYDNKVLPNQSIGSAFTIKNSGEKCYLRIKLYFEVDGTTVLEDNFGLIGLNSKFVKGSDGYYYYINDDSIECKESTVLFMQNIKLPNAFPESWNNNLKIKLEANAIQVGKSSYVSQWVGAIPPTRFTEIVNI